MANDLDLATLEKNIIRSFGMVKEEMTTVQVMLRESQAKNAELIKELNKAKRDIGSLRTRVTNMSKRISDLSRRKRKR